MDTIEKTRIHSSGVANEFKSNKHGDVDSLVITTDNGPLTLHFPPHTAKSVMAHIAVGDTVYVDYAEEAKPDKKPKSVLKAVRKEQHGESMPIGDKKPEKPAKNDATETITPDLFTLVLDKKEKPVAIRVADKYIHLPTNKQISDSIRPDSTLAIEAEPRTDSGFVQEQGLTVYHLKSISINGESFPAND
jgi:hypothetical protein